MQENDKMQAVSGEETATDPTPEKPQKQDPLKKLFSLHYRIPLEEYYDFHLLMGRESVQKNQKRTRLLGWVEVVVGLALIVGMFVNKSGGGVFYLVLALLMMMMGLYGAFYYKLVYPRSLHKAVERQHKSTPYLQHEIVVDFYPNKCTEYVAENHADTFWHEIKDLRETPKLYLVMLAERRCLLVPKSQLTEQERTKMDDLFVMISENFEKRRVKI